MKQDRQECSKCTMASRLIYPEDFIVPRDSVQVFGSIESIFHVEKLERCLMEVVFLRSCILPLVKIQGAIGEPSGL